MTINTSALKAAAGMKMMGEEADNLFKDLARAKESRQRSGVRYVAIPLKYANAKTSGLNVKVETGSQTKDFALTD